MPDLPELKWHGEKVRNAAVLTLDKVSKAVAKGVMRRAKRHLKRVATNTTEYGLLRQFYVAKSKYRNGGWLVFCQGPKKWWKPYHASFLELGTPGTVKRIQNSSFDRTQKRGAGNRKRTNTTRTPIAAKPFMRPAMRDYRRRAKQMYQEALDRL